MGNNTQVILLLAVLILNIMDSYGKGNCNDNCMVTLSRGAKLVGNCDTNKTYISYTNIPYAEPPIGNLRFEKPQPAKPWRGIRDAFSTPRMCTQFPHALSVIQSGEEDCLFVNIYKPKDETRKEPFPVIIWLHPGAFQYGGPNNSPDNVMEQGGAILVLMNYRLGPYGFLSTGDARMSGNNGLKDQRLGFKWVHDNIACFGGDPNKVVLVGNEAGSASVEIHKITDTKYITAYASLSGSVLNRWAFHEKPEIPAKVLGEKLNCSMERKGNSFKNCLKQKKTEDFWFAVKSMQKYRDFSVALFRPTIESKNVYDAIITENPEKLIKLSKNKKKTYYVSCVVGEGAYMAASLLLRNSCGDEVVGELNQIWDEVCPFMFMYEEMSKNNQCENCHKLKEKYMGDKQFNLASYKSYQLMFGDEYFYKPIEDSIALHIAAGQDIYMGVGNLPTRFNMGNLLSRRNDLKFGSVHSADGFAILPTPVNTPPNPYIPGRQETIHNFIEFLISLVTEKEPTYNDTVIPKNTKNGNPDYAVLYMTDGFHEITRCSIMRKIIANVTGSFGVEQDLV